MFLLAWVFGSATYVLSAEAINALDAPLGTAALESLRGVVFTDDIAFKQALASQLGPELLRQYESQLISAAIQMNPMLVLAGIIGFVASFAISLGPVMWVLFSELFPNRLRAAAISLVGFVNSGVSFLVQLLFPWQLANLGSGNTFLIYGLFAFAGLLIILRLLPETRGKSLEQIEQDLVPGLAAAK
jgi:SP family arabinose:H+ symporter-like MFS transporter